MSEATTAVNTDEDDIDLNSYSPDAVEKQMESGGMIPEGYYRAKLDGAKPVVSKSSDKPGWELTYKILDGPFKDRTIDDTVWKPNKEKPATVNRVLMFKHRLGLLGKSADGAKYVPIEGKKDFTDCLDAEVIISIKHEEYTREKDGSKGMSQKLDFNGLFFPNDPKAMERIGKPVEPKGGANGAAGATTPSTASKPAADQSTRKKLDTSEL